MQLRILCVVHFFSIIYCSENFTDPSLFINAINLLQTSREEIIEEVNWNIIQTFEDYLYTNMDSIVEKHFKKLPLQGSLIRQRALIMCAFRRQLRVKSLTCKRFKNIKKDLVKKRYSSYEEIEKINEDVLRMFYGLHRKVAYCNYIGQELSCDVK